MYIYIIFLSSYIPFVDVSGGKKSASDKESGINQVSEKGVELSSMPASQESKNKEVTPSTRCYSVQYKFNQCCLYFNSSHKALKKIVPLTSNL